MAFAPRKQGATANSVPRRTSSLRNPIGTSGSKAPSTPSQKKPEDKTTTTLDATTTETTRKGVVSVTQKPTYKQPTLTRKKSSVSLKVGVSNGVPNGLEPVPSTSANPIVRETQRRPRPMSMSGIPSPTPCKTNSIHLRKDKYTSIANDTFRRPVAPRSVSTVVPNVTKKDVQKESRIASDSAKAPRAATQLEPLPEQPNLTPQVKTPEKPTQKEKLKSPISTTPIKSRPSKEFSPLNRLRHQKSATLTSLPMSSKSVSRESTPKPHPLRPQPSRELSPTPSVQSSPRPKLKGSQPDYNPEQIRLLQLLHHIPLSQAASSTYESSAHRILSARYQKLQTRFERIQENDHAQFLAKMLAILKSWSDIQIRTFSTLLSDWESLTIDFRAFCKRLSNTLKPVNKGILEEKDRLFSRLHDLELVLEGLPSTGGLPGEILDEVRNNIPLLKREAEMNVTVAGLRWRKEVLVVEMKRIEVAKRMSLGKSSQENIICAWREQ